MLAGTVTAQEVHLDLSSHFNYDAFVESGSGSGTPLNATYGWLDANTLPEGFTVGQLYAEDEVSFLFGDLKAGAMDSVRIDTQTLPAPAGNYDLLHLALLTPSNYTNLSKKIRLNYKDGSSQDIPFAPISNWFDSPLRYADRHLEFTDSSGVTYYYDFVPQQGDTDFIYEIVGGSPNEVRSDYRFVDGGDSLTYDLDLEDNVEQAQLGINMQNNFVVGISTDYGATYTDVLISQDIYGTDIHNGSNRKNYEVDLAPFLAASTDNDLFVKFTDGSTGDGWGPAVYRVSIYTGDLVLYTQDDLTDIDASNATVYADFRTDGTATEQSYIKELSGTSLSAQTSSRHRYADNGSYVVYQFDLPNNASDAKIAVNMEANFVVSVAKDFSLQTLLEFQPGGERDLDYILVDQANNAGDYRFVDGGSSLIYWFDLPDNVSSARLNLELENNFVVSLSKDDAEYIEELNSFEMYGSDIHDGSNHKVYEIDLTPYLANNSTKEVYVQFADGTTNDGWGPAIRNVSIVTGQAPEYTTVLTQAETSAGSVFGYNGQSTQNKGYYIMDLSSFLANNPEKTLFVKFSDATTNDGWGPGLFRILAYSGTIVPDVNDLAITGVKTTLPQPASAYPWGVNLQHISYPVDKAKELSSVTFPDVEDTANVYLFAATLTGETTTDVNVWSLY